MAMFPEPLPAPSGESASATPPSPGQNGIAPLSAAAHIHAGVPDPLKPLPRPAPRSLPHGKLALRQYARRADLLSAARAQIAEGRQEINVKRLAQSCDLAVQTVYNIVGDRDDIMLAAVDEHYVTILSAAACMLDSINPFAALAEALWAFAWRNPDYVRSLLQTYHAPQSAVSRSIEANVRRAIITSLTRLEGEHIVDPADLEAHADRIGALITLSSFDWMHGKLTLLDLRVRLLADFEFALNGLRRRA